MNARAGVEARGYIPPRVAQVGAGITARKNPRDADSTPRMRDVLPIAGLLSHRLEVGLVQLGFRQADLHRLTVSFQHKVAFGEA